MLIFWEAIDRLRIARKSSEFIASRIESLEPGHRHDPLFHSAMILLYNIVQVFTRPVR